jgi:hypothetical protein
MKNEEPYIIEWVAYHRLIGFDRIIIYENDSTDLTPVLLKKLFSAGIIDGYKTWSNIDGSPQISAYEDAARNCTTDWIMFLDADEFLNIFSGRVNDLLDDYNDDVVGIAVNWRIFGSGGERWYRDNPVLERFTRASLLTCPINKHVKSFSRPSFIEEMHIHAPKMLGRAVTTSSSPLTMKRQGLSDVPDFFKAQINHYFTKSVDEYEIKRIRGNANRNNTAIDKFTRYTDDLFKSHDLNDEEDISIMRVFPEILEEIGKIRQAITLSLR